MGHVGPVANIATLASSSLNSTYLHKKSWLRNRNGIHNEHVTIILLVADSKLIQHSERKNTASQYSRQINL